MRKQETVQAKAKYPTAAALSPQKGAHRENKSQKTFQVIYIYLPFALDGEICMLTLGKCCQ